MINISKNECVGCEACRNICPKDAISMRIETGFTYPLVNADKCVDCHLCEKICPANNELAIKNSNPEVLAVWSKNEQVRKQCTSGGVCYELSKYIIENGGYVAGVVWSEDYKDAHYIVTNSLLDLDRLKQSKYFQPCYDGVYSKVKLLLDDGIEVLFIGSACTNDALKRFLRKDYQNLYCIDYICRGYTSQVFHEKRVEYLEKKHNSKIKSVQYKNKNLGWTRFGTLFTFENNDEEYINRNDDSYELMFKIEDNNTRPSCYDCKYRNIPRHTDITLGDFWGIKGVEQEDLDNGVSVVLISSEKGKTLFNNVRDSFVFAKRTIEDVKSGNGALLNQLKKPNNAEKFFDDLNTLPFSKIEKKYGNKRILQRRYVMKILKTICHCNLFQFAYLNFLNKTVIRKRHKFIFPYYGSRVQMEKGAKIFINDNLFMNTPKHKHSNEQCYLKILSGGVFEVNGVCRLAANNTIEINHDALLKAGQFDSNYGTTIICGNRIEIGDGVGFGRNVMIYDNNFHTTGLNKKVKLKPLIIEDHVWLCTGVTIVKGLKIEKGAVCSINSTVTRNVKSKNMVSGNPAKVMMTNVEW